MTRTPRHHALAIFTAMLTMWSAIACKCLAPIAAAQSSSAIPSSSPSLQGGLPNRASHPESAHACCATKSARDQPVAPSHENQPDCNHCLTASASLAPTVGTPAVGELAFSHVLALIHTPPIFDTPLIAPTHRHEAREGPPPRDALTLRAQHTLLTV